MPIGSLIVTAAHVTPQLREVVQIWSPEAGHPFPALVVGVSAEWDVAVLVPRKPVEMTPMRSGYGGVVGEPVWHAGYPAPLNLPVVRRGRISLVVTHPDQAAVVDRSMFASDLALPTPAALLVDVPTFPGASGGPVVDEEGTVIGLVSRGPTAPKYGVPMGLAIVTRLGVALARSGLKDHFPELDEETPDAD